MDSPGYSTYEPPESLWRLVEESVSLEERTEIREILGDSLVDQSLELHAEANMLLEIWQSYKALTDTMTTNRKLLPEPPGVRESLRNHIKMLVESIQETAQKSGRNSEVVLCHHKSDIIEYAMDDSSRGSSPSCIQSRPSSSFSSRSGRDTPMRMTPSSEDDGLSSTTSASEKVDSVRNSLNVLKIDEVVQQLRNTLRDEVSQLLTDIKFLQNCLEDEREFRCESQMSVYSEPSIQELREERSKLERTSSLVPNTADVMNSVPRGNRRPITGSTINVLKPLSPISTSGVQRVRPSPPSSADKGQRSRTVRLKTRTPPGDKTLTRSRETIDPGNSINSRTLNNNMAVCKGPLVTNPSGSGGPSSPPLRPSPPSSAKRLKGSPTVNRFRQRLRNSQRENST